MELKGKEVTGSFQSEVDSYWIGRENEALFACPNVSLFRLIGNFIGSLERKQVLEIGFAHGEDLMECKRRGADVVGLDLNPTYVETVKKRYKCDVRQFRAGTDAIPFNKEFDLIYSRDTICYLTDQELFHFFLDCFKNISSHGNLIIQFIETDLFLKSAATKDTQNFDIDFLHEYEAHRIHSEINPIRFLYPDNVISIAEANGFVLVGTKTMLQSYDLHEAEIRVDKYLLFNKLTVPLESSSGGE